MRPGKTLDISLLWDVALSGYKQHIKNHHIHHSNHHHYGPLSKGSGVIKLVPKATASQCTTLVLSKALKAIVSKWVQGKNYLKHRHNSAGNFLVSDPVLVLSGQFGFLIPCEKIAMIA